MKNYSQLNKEEILFVLNQHELYIKSNEDQGEQAWISKTNLSHMDLKGRNLSRITFAGCDLSYCDLSYCDLSLSGIAGCNLKGANLSSANFFGANFRMSNLSESTIIETLIYNGDFEGCNFNKSHFSDIAFHYCNLAKATFNETELQIGGFHVCSMEKADFTNSTFRYFSFSFIDLSETIGLDKCFITAPCEIGFNTLIKSKDHIPHSFLKQCGFNPKTLSQLPKLFHETNYPELSCFVSFSYKDKEFTEKLVHGLRNLGIKLWFAPEDIKGGKYIKDQIDKSIDENDKLILILSNSSMHSNWVSNEIKKAYKKELRTNKNVLFPISLIPFDEIKNWELFDSDLGIDLAAEIRKYFISDFSTWRNKIDFDKSLNKLIQDLTTTK